MTQFPYHVLRFKEEADWLDRRHDWVTSSDMAAILNISHTYTTPRLLWLEKRERKSHRTGENDYSIFGKRFEPLVAQDFEDATGMSLQPRNYGWPDCPYTLYVSKTTPLACSVDYLCGQDLLPVEIKNAWHEQARVWDKGVPLSHQVQIQTQMAVLGAPLGYFACWLHRGGPPIFRLHPIYRDELVIERITEAAIKFREQVVQGIPPEVDGSPLTTAALAAEFVDTADDEIILDGEFDDKRNAIIDLEAQADELAHTITKYRNEFRAAIGAATSARLPSGKRVTWRPDKNGKRTLRI